MFALRATYIQGDFWKLTFFFWLSFWKYKSFYHIYGLKFIVKKVHFENDIIFIPSFKIAEICQIGFQGEKNRNATLLSNLNFIFLDFYSINVAFCVLLYYKSE